MATSQSVDYNALKVWKEAVSDAGYPQTGIVWMERFNIINRALKAVIGLFYDLLADTFMDYALMLPNNVGRYFVSGGSFSAATGILNATMNSNFASTDVGNLIVFWLNTNVYVATITNFISVTSVTVSGNNLPANDLASLTGCVMAGTSPQGNSLSLNSLRMMRTGQQVAKMTIESTITQSIEWSTIEDVYQFRGGKQPNMILWNLSGNNIVMAKGSALSNFGTLTIRFPRIPNLVVGDTDMIDLPDGPAIEILIIKIRQIAANRFLQTGYDVKPFADPTAELSNLVTQLHNVFGQSVKVEKINEEVQNLI